MCHWYWLMRWLSHRLCTHWRESSAENKPNTGWLSLSQSVQGLFLLHPLRSTAHKSPQCCWDLPQRKQEIQSEPVTLGKGVRTSVKWVLLLCAHRWKGQLYWCDKSWSKLFFFVANMVGLKECMGWAPILTTILPPPTHKVGLVLGLFFSHQLLVFHFRVGDTG